ncbi:MAG TPA: CRTAC1 family protein [Verrucomicrobiae bacterium]|nr:CRTAC1 family protein [Verrucomicrobiae bacterium]
MTAPTGHAQTSFTKITTGPVATDSEQSVGCAWGDYDNDGFIDLFVTRFDNISVNMLYHNERDGTFTRFIAGAPANESNVRSAGCIWGDFDNDGFLDLFVANLGTTAINWLYHNNGNGTFQKMTGAQAGAIASNPAGRSVSAAWGDFDADGNLDLFVANGALAENNVDALYRNLGQGRFTNIAVASGITEALFSTQGTWADVDGDGRLDLFVTHNAGQGNYIYRNLGGGAFRAISSGNALNEALNSVGSAWGDYDNDGHLDLFVVNSTLDASPYQNVLYRNDGSGVFERITTGDIVNEFSSRFRSCAWADYDNDGHLDLFVTQEGSNNRLYHNNGDGTFLSVTEGAVVTDIAASTGCSWGDYNNDGFLDLFVANGGLSGRQSNFLYRNDRNSNHWIKVRCVGTVSNRSAIGAIVRARALINGAIRWQMRHISGGDGWLCQNSLDVSIGFGSATNIDLLRIEWPSGIIQELHDVTVDQTLIVEEPSWIQSSAIVGGGFELTLKGGGRDAFGRHRAYDIETSADFVGWSTLTNVVVTNADGTATLRDASPGEAIRFYRARRSASE